MRTSSILSLMVMAGSCLAQGDLGALLASQEDLSTLLDLVGLIDGLADTLSSATNITIFAPTNQAFANVPRNVPEGEAIEGRNDTAAIGALLANHVFKGAYPASAVTDTPLFVQSLLNSSYENAIQPFSNFTGGAYNGLVRNGDDVCVLSGELTVSTVTQADVMLGEGITIHKVDTVLSFGAPLQLFTYRAGYTVINAAIEAADLGIDFGLSSETPGLNVSDFTVFVPTNEAFERIGSVLATADQKTLQDVLKYHIIASDVVFSTALGNVSVPTLLEGYNLTFTVLPDGSAWVNGARITFPNNILFNGVAHVIDQVLAPGNFDRSTLDPNGDRVAFPGASSVSSLPFSTVSFAGDLELYTTTPVLLQTVAAVPTPTTAAGTSSTMGMGSMTSSTGMPAATSSGTVEAAGAGIFPRAVAVVGVAAGVAGFLV